MLKHLSTVADNKKKLVQVWIFESSGPTFKTISNRTLRNITWTAFHDVIITNSVIENHLAPFLCNVTSHSLIKTLLALSRVFIKHLWRQKTSQNVTKTTCCIHASKKQEYDLHEIIHICMKYIMLAWEIITDTTLCTIYTRNAKNSVSFVLNASSSVQTFVWEVVLHGVNNRCTTRHIRSGNSVNVASSAPTYKHVSLKYVRYISPTFLAVPSMNLCWEDFSSIAFSCQFQDFSNPWLNLISFCSHIAPSNNWYTVLKEKKNFNSWMFLWQCLLCAEQTNLPPFAETRG